MRILLRLVQLTAYAALAAVGVCALWLAPSLYWVLPRAVQRHPWDWLAVVLGALYLGARWLVTSRTDDRRLDGLRFGLCRVDACAAWLLSGPLAALVAAGGLVLLLG